MEEGGSLRIVHVLRAPVGGLFRHVCDLARGQAALGHRVGVVADAATGGEHADARFAQLAPHLALGITRVGMSRHIGWGDFAACAHVARRAGAVGADVVHGHGAKGGAYARLSRRGVRVYTPHGGSLHYAWNSPVGVFYLASERLLARRTDLLLFESAYARNVFETRVGKASALARIVHNGVADEEFEPVPAAPDATDLIFVGELRRLKGVDVLIAALAMLAREGRNVSATIAGQGRERGEFEAFAAAEGVSDAIRFVGPMPARCAFARARALVVPSRAESLPYIVLEGAAAGIPMLVTKVGGIAEIFGPDAGALISPGDPGALARAIARILDNPREGAEQAERLRERVRTAFSVEAMTGAVLAGYREALSRRRAG